MGLVMFVVLRCVGLRERGWGSSHIFFYLFARERARERERVSQTDRDRAGERDGKRKR